MPLKHCSFFDFQITRSGNFSVPDSYSYTVSTVLAAMSIYPLNSRVFSGRRRKNSPVLYALKMLLGLYSAKMIWRLYAQDLIASVPSATLLNFHRHAETWFCDAPWSTRGDLFTAVHFKSSLSWDANSCALTMRGGEQTGTFWSLAFSVFL